MEKRNGKGFQVTELLEGLEEIGHRKMASIRDKLIGIGASTEALDAIKAPAGIDIGAISPEEIALSIFAEITAKRRQLIKSV